MLQTINHFSSCTLIVIKRNNGGLKNYVEDILNLILRLVIFVGK